MRLFLFLLFFCLFPNFSLTAQPGCTDSLATNYNPDATMNDGSCTYPPTNISLVVKTNLDDTLEEASGLAWADGSVWVHNDGGSDPNLYRIDSLSNTTLQIVTMEDIPFGDWEDIAFDGLNFYLGDFGNNADGNRMDLRIYKFPLAAIPSGSAVVVPDSQVEVIHFSYEDQTNFDPTGGNNTRFDCEAMVYRNDTLHLFTKDWVGKTTTHYSLPAIPGDHQARKMETFDVEGLITGADISSAGVILLLGYDFATATSFLWQLWDYSEGLFFSGNKRRIELGHFLTTGQVEGLCFRTDRYGYVCNEITDDVIPGRLYSFGPGLNLLSPVSDLKQNPTPAWCARLPNPATAGQLLDFLNLHATDNLVEIWDSQGRLFWQSGTRSAVAEMAFPSGVYFLQVRELSGIPVCRRAVFVR